jgi:DNA replication protein DnaC
MKSSRLACSTCRDSGWVLKNRDGATYAAPCPDCRAVKKVESLLKNAAIPPRYLDRGFDVYATQTKSQEKALLRAVQYVNKYPDVPRGLLFVGPCGVGKTHLSVAILKQLILDKRTPGMFIDESELLRRLQYSYSPNSPETEKEVMLPLMNIELLVWDDLGAGRTSEWVSETIRTVLNHRYTYEKQTILSTNWPLKVESARTAQRALAAGHTLPERIGQRLFSRITEMCEIVDVQGPDARIEIHKARLDFQESSAQADRVVVPIGLLTCPKCASAKLDERGSSKLKTSRAGNYVEVACLCRDCAAEFVARFYPQTAKFEYVQS